MTGFARPEISELHAYEEEPHGALNLMGNTNLFGTNPALAQGLAGVHSAELSEYPSLTSISLRAAVARKHGIGEDLVVTGNGSNELIDVLMRTFLSPGETVAFHTPTFSMIPTFVRANHGVCRPVPLGKDWSLDADALIAEQAKVTFLVRPNNPTGNAFPRAEVERVLNETRGVVVVDEAYVEFLDDSSFLQEIRDGHERLIVLRTLSKAHGLAGLRIGFGVASEGLARELAKVRGPFRLNAVSETIGALALQDDAFLGQVVAGVRAERPTLARELTARGFEVFPSDANFILARPPVDARGLTRKLSARGVAVRDFGEGPLAPFLRITVGPPAVTAQFLAALDSALATNKEDAV